MQLTTIDSAAQTRAECSKKINDRSVIKDTADWLGPNIAELKKEIWRAKQTELLTDGVVPADVAHIRALQEEINDKTRSYHKFQTQIAKLDAEIRRCQLKREEMTSLNGPCAGFTGEWRTNWGTMTLNHGSGSYTHSSGKISGSVSGNVLNGTWTQPNGTGKVQLELNDSGGFTGHWTRDPSSQVLGDWTGTCIK